MIADETGVEVLKVPPYIKVPDAVKLFGFNRQRLWKLIRRKEIRASRSGRNYHIQTLSILKHLKRNEYRRPTV